MKRRIALGLLLPPLLLAGCLVDPDRSAALARQSLDSLQKQPDAASYAPEALAEAAAAVAAAEGLQPSGDEAAHRAFVAQKKVQIAAWTAAANRDRAAYAQLLARRDALRHGSRDVVTLSTDALGVTPQRLDFHPLAPEATPGSGPKPVPARAAKPVQPPAASGPLLRLAATAFDGNTALTPVARKAVDRLLPALKAADAPPVLICFGGTDRQARSRAAAVKDYLQHHGVPRQRLLVASMTGNGAVPAGGVLIEFE